MDRACRQILTKNPKAFSTADGNIEQASILRILRKLKSINVLKNIINPKPQTHSIIM